MGEHKQNGWGKTGSGLDGKKKKSGPPGIQVPGVEVGKKLRLCTASPAQKPNQAALRTLFTVDSFTYKLLVDGFMIV